MGIRKLTGEDFRDGLVDVSRGIHCDVEYCSEESRPVRMLRKADAENRVQWYEEMASHWNEEGWRIVEEARQVLCPKHVREAEAELRGDCP